MRILLLLPLLFLTSNLFAQNENEEKEALRKKNQIKTMLVYQYDVETGDSLLYKQHTYDKEGRFLTYSSYNEEGKMSYQYIAEYNSKGWMSKQTGYKEEQELSTILLYDYDKKGNQIAHRQVNPEGKTLVHQKRVYNRKGQNTILYNKLGDTPTFTVGMKFYYRKDGQYEKTESYLPNGKLWSTSLYEYDKRGNDIACYKITQGKKALSYTTTYNKNNKETALIFAPKMAPSLDPNALPNTAPRKRTYAYDQAGNLIEKCNWEGTTLEERERYFFKYHQ